MTGLEGAYAVRVLMSLSILANIVLGLVFNVLNEEPSVHLALIVAALPLVVGCHLIIKKYESVSGDTAQQIKIKREQAEKMYARLMFSWFGIVAGGFYLYVFLM